MNCTICGTHTDMVGTGLCDNCWEIRTRLDYKTNDKARVYFLNLLARLLGFPEPIKGGKDPCSPKS